MKACINDTTIVAKLVGARLRKAREDKNLSRQAFCNRINEREDRPIRKGEHEMLSIERLKKWEYGENPISLEWLPVICAALEVDYGFLFGEYPEHTRTASDIVAATGLSQDTADFILHNRLVSETLNSIDNRMLLLFAQRLSQIEDAVFDAVSLIDGVAPTEDFEEAMPWLSAYNSRQDIELSLYRFQECCREIAEFCDIHGVLKDLDSIWVPLFPQEKTGGQQ